MEHEHELLQTLIDTIPVMVTVCDPNLQRFSLNREFLRVLGWTEQDLYDGDPMKNFILIQLSVRRPKSSWPHWKAAGGPSR
jgi:PAS domain-containing protein